MCASYLAYLNVNLCTLSIMFRSNVYYKTVKLSALVLFRLILDSYIRFDLDFALNIAPTFK